MKQLSEQVLQPDEIIMSKQNEAKKTLKYLGKVKLHKGMILFQINVGTSLITPAEIDESVIDLKGGIRRKVVIKENCLYAPAINIKNAERKFLKMLSR